MKVKSWLALLLALVMVFALCACGGGQQTPPPAQNGGQTGDQPQTQAPAPDDGQTYTLRLGTFPGDTMTFMEKFKEYVEQESNGRITVEVMNFLTLGSPADAVSMTKDGSLDMMTISGTNYVGYEPCAAVVAVPNVVSNVTEAYELEKALLDAGYFADWDGEVLAVMMTDMQYIATATKEIKSAADFNGMVGRCQNANGIAVLQEFGSTITTINTNEVYMSLETGVIDFSVSSPTNMVSSAYQEVVDYIVDYPLYCDANCIVMNKDSYAKLPEDLQKVLKSCGEKIEKDYQDWLVDAEAEAIQTMKDAGVTFTACPDDVAQVIESVAGPCMDQYLATLKEAGVDTDAFKAFVDEHLGK